MMSNYDFFFFGEAVRKKILFEQNTDCLSIDCELINKILNEIYSLFIFIKCPLFAAYVDKPNFAF